MRRAEAAYLADRREQRPILLLDDVLSELDASRRAHVLERARSYEQCFITTTDADATVREHSHDARRLSVAAGMLSEVEPP